MSSNEVNLMLRESNAIEGVYGNIALSDARKAWDFMMMYETMNPQILQHAHKLLMSRTDLDEKYRGKWRPIPVSIGGVLKNDPPLVIDRKIKDHCKHILKVIKTKDKNHQFPLHCHVEFEEIHPFVDGNGRMGRMLLNWTLKQLDMPLVIYTEADKRTYYRLFQSYRSMEMLSIWEQIRRDNFSNL